MIITAICVISILVIGIVLLESRKFIWIHKNLNKHIKDYKKDFSITPQKGLFYQLPASDEVYRSFFQRVDTKSLENLKFRITIMQSTNDSIHTVASFISNNILPLIAVMLAGQALYINYMNSIDLFHTIKYLVLFTITFIVIFTIRFTSQIIIENPLATYLGMINQSLAERDE
ncbi:hypothetical protein [Paenibacillus sp. NEAU-GSW1]|uniref:hypothetical protein n=1 Tax=Paenibacillus sp. NEAU-GSW1 TaxID=2682486 RepID=UPI0012E14E22|nr:hypothetical protein [Paenibacillus sp. NEAU-GSW1]MUT65962.1 hypothetical protein [Paenibacillus sp. NEAU-GSW1]